MVSSFKHPVTQRLSADRERPHVPLPIGASNRAYFAEHEIQAYLAALLGIEPPPLPLEIRLLTSAEVAERLGIAKRTLKRRVAEALKAKAEAEARALAESDA
jgi:hypothetical protein